MELDDNEFTVVQLNNNDSGVMACGSYDSLECLGSNNDDLSILEPDDDELQVLESDSDELGDTGPIYGYSKDVGTRKTERSSLVVPVLSTILLQSPKSVESSPFAPQLHTTFHGTTAQ